MGMPPLRRLDLWLPPLLLMAVIFYLSAQPNLDSGLGSLDLVARKLAHLAEYALLCLLYWRALAPGSGARRAALVAFLLASAYAATDEYHQSFVETRNGSPVDWAIDTAGAGAAALWLRAGSRRRAAA
jgi:VanZ family protein